PLAAPTGDWREDLWLMAQWTREEALAHPAVQEIRRTFRVYTPEILVFAERWLSLWLQSGLDLKSAILAARTSSLAVAGILSEEATFRQLDKPEPSTTAQLPNARLLLFANDDPNVMFESAIRSIIDGLHTRFSAQDVAAKARQPRSGVKGARRG